MKHYIRKSCFLALVCLIIAACGSEQKESKGGIPTKEFLKAEIKNSNDTLQLLYKNILKTSNQELPSEKINDAIYTQLQYVHYYPKDAYSAICLDKVQQLYLQKKDYKKSLDYTDSLLLNFPKFKGRANLLLNAGSTGEILKDTTVIRKYYTQLLTEYPKLDVETREMLEFRLQNLKLTFDELIELQMQRISKK